MLPGARTAARRGARALRGMQAAGPGPRVAAARSAAPRALAGAARAAPRLPARAPAARSAARGLATIAGGPGDVIEVDQATFKSKVMDSKVPVVLDCYADWCGPCKTLEPILKKAVAAYKGKVVLAKLDTDAQPELAQALQVKSLPTVMAIYQGKLVHHFIGAQSEAQVNDFLANVVKMTGADQGQPGADGNAIETAEGLIGQVEQAIAAGNIPNDQIVPALKQLADVQPEDGEKDREVKARFEKVRARALVGLGQLALKDGNVQDANALVKMLQSSYKTHLDEPAVQSFVRAVSFAETAGDVSTDELSDFEARRADLSSEERFKFAQSLVSQKRYDEAIDEALVLLKKDRAFQDEAAKKLLLEIFELLGPKDDLVKAARRRMASILLV